MAGEAEASASTGARGISLRPWDFAFLAITLATLVSIAALGVGSYRSAHDLELVKRHAESVAGRLEAIASGRAGASADPPACARQVANNASGGWAACLSAIRSAPDISALKNGLVPSNQPFGKACSTEDPATRGTIVLERGTEWFSAGTTGTSFAPAGDDDPIDREVVLRVRVCDRWGAPVTVREVKF